LIGNEQIHILASSELLAELEGVAMRPSIQKYINHEQVNQFIALLIRRFDVVPVTSVVQICRDPNDDFLLALCKDGQAEYLLTGDKDLLSLHSFEATRIVNLSDFEEALG
jgi:putative PIN family toxin of toxin-antitoxin system